MRSAKEIVISVLLPTVRPHKLAECLPSVRAGVPIEVVVVADFTQPIELRDDERINWVERERHGVVDAVNVAYARARGEYLFLYNDESKLSDGALDVMLELARDNPKSLVTLQHVPPFNFVYYGIPFAPFPFAHRDFYEAIGGMLDPVYKGFYADPDLSLRVYTNGLKVLTALDAEIHHCNAHDDDHYQRARKYADADRATFRQRWDHLGRFIDP